MTPFIATVLLFLLAPGEAVAAEGWRRPLGEDGTVAKAFAYDRAAPFAGGARRGLDVAGTPGAPVGAVCRGLVTWAGGVPGWGRGVTLRCSGGLVATELGLASTAVRRGASVPPGAMIGRLATRGVLRVGARRGADRFGWIDPAPLFADRPSTPRIAPPAPVRRRIEPPRTTAPRRVAAPAPAVAPRPATAPGAVAAPSLPVPVLAGLALLATAATGAPAARRRRRRRPTAEIALAQR